MTASKQAKTLGAKSLKQVSEVSGVPVRTLHDWYEDKPDLFETVVVGCVYQLRFSGVDSHKLALLMEILKGD